MRGMTSRIRGFGQEAFDPKHVYYINLDRRPDRRSSMEGQLPLLGFPIIRWPAVWLTEDEWSRHANVISDRGVEAYVLEGKYTYGTIGCYLSHLQVLEHIAESGSEQSLVFEDDILIEAGFLSAAQALLLQVPPYDMILFDCFGSRFAPDRINSFVYHPSRNFPHFWGAHAYLVGRGKVDKILRSLRKRKIKDIDGLFLGAEGFRRYVVYTGLLKDGNFGSDRVQQMEGNEEGA
jgi:GR25 family glycosyltransferase involved in LPS biosynthesis